MGSAGSSARAPPGSPAQRSARRKSRRMAALILRTQGRWRHSFDGERHEHRRRRWNRPGMNGEDARQEVRAGEGAAVGQEEAEVGRHHHAAALGAAQVAGGGLEGGAAGGVGRVWGWEGGGEAGERKRAAGGGGGAGGEPAVSLAGLEA